MELPPFKGTLWFEPKESEISKCLTAYVPECRQQLAELAHTGHSVNDVAQRARQRPCRCCRPKRMSRKGLIELPQVNIELSELIGQTRRASDQAHGMLRMVGVRPCMRTVGNAQDNAMDESFFATLKCERIARRSLRTKTEARLGVFTWESRAGTSRTGAIGLASSLTQ